MSDPLAGKTICPVIAGPTAVGKTSLILQLAAEYPIEVISLDSRQIYQGLRIGTAQPSPEEQTACPHHLVDFLAPESRWSAQEFRKAFAIVYQSIRARDAMPVLVGGAGLYLTAVQDGFMEIDADPLQQEAVRRELDELDDLQLSAALQDVDPESHDRLHENDRYRRQRALEIQRLTGRSMTDHMAAQQPNPALGLAFPLIVLDRDRAILRARIAARLQVMLAQGWLAETRALLEDHDADCPGLRTLGYAELVAHLRGEITLDDASTRITIQTGQYAKRQQTWFRAREALLIGEPEAPEILSTLRRLLDTMC
jgi:tRNA dimethylallyltransferase